MADPASEHRGDMAAYLCRTDDTMGHHDQTDDYPCSRCSRTADVVLASPVLADMLAAARAEDRESIAAGIDRAREAHRARGSRQVAVALGALADGVRREADRA